MDSPSKRADNVFLLRLVTLNQSVARSLVCACTIGSSMYGSVLEAVA
jgi:hypothetical protein